MLYSKQTQFGSAWPVRFSMCLEKHRSTNFPPFLVIRLLMACCLDGSSIELPWEHYYLGILLISVVMHFFSLASNRALVLSYKYIYPGLWKQTNERSTFLVLCLSVQIHHLPRSATRDESRKKQNKVLFTLNLVHIPWYTYSGSKSFCNGQGVRLFKKRVLMSFPLCFSV